jgi:hypothetical protein
MKAIGGNNGSGTLGAAMARVECRALTRDTDAIHQVTPVLVSLHITVIKGITVDLNTSR